MKKTDLLNTASDLRRIANWIGRGQEEKIPLILELTRNIKSKKEWTLVKKYFNPDAIYQKFHIEKERIYLAEQALLASLKLIHLSSSEN